MSRRRDATALSDGIWQDRDILFDLESRLLRLIPGERLVERIENVEDTKGNNGDKGVLRVTNIRLIWHANSMPRINLSIGYNAVNGVTTRIAKSKIRGQAESLYLMARNATTRFEFVFTCVNPAHTKLFTTVIGIHRAYETSKLYRELKMRGALVDDEEKLRILPLEQQCDRIEGGNLGVLIITNIRIVWYASMNPNYNSGEYILGFRVDPEEKLELVCKAIQAMHSAYLASPIFGVQYAKDRNEPTTSISNDDNAEQIQEDAEIDEKPTRIDAFAAYFSDGGTNEEARPIVYSEELGVAIEQLKHGFTLSDLWNIHIE
uniref:Bardet-Biedl syndrome 5 protein n=1 Tax=Acrobeloides nanus TaxID=290746 RepID=A0A914CAB6_9BILA